MYTVNPFITALRRRVRLLRRCFWESSTEGAVMHYVGIIKGSGFDYGGPPTLDVGPDHRKERALEGSGPSDSSPSVRSEDRPLALPSPYVCPHGEFYAEPLVCPSSCPRTRW